MCQSPDLNRSFYRTSRRFMRKSIHDNGNNSGYNYNSVKSTKRSYGEGDSSTLVSSLKAGDRNRYKNKSINYTTQDYQETARKLFKSMVLTKGITPSYSKEILNAHNFRRKLEKIFISHKIKDYKNFDYKAHMNEADALRPYFSSEYTRDEINGLLKIYTQYEYEPGHILKEVDAPFIPVMIIIKGKVGVYYYPEGKKTLYRVLRSKDIIGDYELNFIASKSSQYEVLTKTTIIKFPKNDYERVVYNREVESRKEKISYLKENYNFFSTMKEDQLYRLSK